MRRIRRATAAAKLQVSSTLETSMTEERQTQSAVRHSNAAGSGGAGWQGRWRVREYISFVICGGVEKHRNCRVCHEFRRMMEHLCGNTASTERRRMHGDTSLLAIAEQRGSSHPVRTLSSSRAAADRVRTLVLTPDSKSPYERTPRATSAHLPWSADHAFVFFSAISEPNGLRIRL